MINLVSVRKILTECDAIHEEIMAPRSQWSPNPTKDGDMLSINELRQIVKSQMTKPTQSEMSRQLGISQAYLNLIIKGKRTPKNQKQILETVRKELGK
jgi:hypothetical protein